MNILGNSMCPIFFVRNVDQPEVFSRNVPLLESITDSRLCKIPMDFKKNWTKLGQSWKDFFSLFPHSLYGNASPVQPPPRCNFFSKNWHNWNQINIVNSIIVERVKKVLPICALYNLIAFCYEYIVLLSLSFSSNGILQMKMAK